MDSPHPGPVVGVVGHGHVVAKGFGPLAVTGTPHAFTAAVAAAGGRPIILPPLAAANLLDVVDALVLTGGGDVDPATYGGTGPALEVDRDRDAAEIALVRAAAEARVPVLGVCRGLQVLAVALGGTLTGGLDHVDPLGGHAVRTSPGSLVHELVGGRTRTSALHRQAVAETGPNWRPTAWSDDGTVEAIEPVEGAWPALGVQWHPELHWSAELEDSTGPAVFGWLVEAAQAGSQPPPTPTQGSELPWKPSPLPLRT